MPRRFELIFHRIENATQPEAFGLRDPVTGELEPIPHTYQRCEGDLPIASSTLAWSYDWLAMLEELQQGGSDPDLRHAMGALLREFLTYLAWSMPEELDDGGGRAAEGTGKKEL